MNTVIVDVLRLAAAQTASQTGRARRVIDAAGIADADVARAVGISFATQCRWANGQRRPRGAKAVVWIDLIDALEQQLAGDATVVSA